MSTVAPGWYPDPAEPTTQRYWDGDGWVGDPLPAGTTPPAGPPPPSAPPVVPTGPSYPAPYHVPTFGGSPPGPFNGPTVGGPDGPPTGIPPTGIPPTGAPQTGAPGWGPGQPGAGGPTWHGAPGQAGPSPFPFGAVPMPHGLELATPGARLAARLIDISLVLLLNVVGNGWFVYQYVQNVLPAIREGVRQIQAGVPNPTLPALPDDTNALLFAILFVALALWYAYEVPMVANAGQTLGKRLVGIKVVRLENTEPLGFGRSTRRWLRMGWPTLFWPCYGIGLVLQAMDSLFVVIDKPLRQAIHDKIAFTVVVKTPKEGVR